MNNRLIGALAALLVVPGFAAAQIANSPHDFTSGNPKSTYQFATTLCETCHFPHAPAQGGSGPLWNHANGSSTYTPYASGTFSGSGSVSLGYASKMCLACHDGTVAPDAYGTETTGTADKKLSGSVLVGTNLSNDHPIGFAYSSTNEELGDATSGVVNGHTGDPTTTGMPLFLAFGTSGTGTQMECASCHDPHNNTTGEFLRSTKKTFCQECHTK